jgi:hypothetical protein
MGKKKRPCGLSHRKGVSCRETRTPMVKRGKGREPRTMAGGKSDRHARRRAARGRAREYAGEWTDAAANKLLEALHEDCKKKGLQIVQNTLNVLLDMQRARALVTRAARGGGMSAPDQRLALEQLAFYAGKVRTAHASSEKNAAKKAVRAFLKPLRERRASEDDLAPLVVEPAVRGPATFHAWLSARPEDDRARSIAGNQRILTGLQEWFPNGSWFPRAVVICYESAASRARSGPNSRGAPCGPSHRARETSLYLLTAQSAALVRTRRTL